MGHNFSNWFTQSYFGFRPGDLPLVNGARTLKFGLGLTHEIETKPITIAYAVAPIRAMDIHIGTNVIADDFLVGGIGGDRLIGGGGDDLISGEYGADRLGGGTGNDMLFGGAGDDTIWGHSGDDFIAADGMMRRDGNPLSFGEIFMYDRDTGNTRIDPISNSNPGMSGTPNHIYVTEQKGGNDVVYAGDGNDIVLGGGGSDWLFGGNGHDVIDAGERGDRDNEDFVIGGAGKDVFVLGGDGSNGANEMLQALSGFAQSQGTSALSGWSVKSLFNELDYAGISGLSALSDFKLTTGAKMAGSLLTGVLSSAISGYASTMIEMLITHIEDQKPSSEDVIRVLDFDPTEDVLFVPYGSLTEQSVVIDVASGYARPDSDGNLTGGDEQVITIRNVGDTDPFAIVYLSKAFLAKVGITNPNGAMAKEILESVTQSAMDLSRDGVTDQDGITTAVAVQSDSEAVVRVMGAASAKVHFAEASFADAPPIIGTHHGDLLSANPEAIDAGTEHLDSNAFTQPVGIYGFGGDDLIYGGRGADKLYGGNGNDDIFAFGAVAGWDEARGGAGRDVIHAGSTDNALKAVGGYGIDTIDFSHMTHGVDLTAGRFHDMDIGRYGLKGHTRDDDRDATPDFMIAQVEAAIGTDHADVFDFSHVREFGMVRYFEVEGGAGRDTFTPALGGGVTVTDFQAFEDTIDVSSFGITRMKDLTIELFEDQAWISGTSRTGEGGDFMIHIQGDNLTTFSVTRSILLSGRDADDLMGANELGGTDYHMYRDGALRDGEVDEFILHNLDPNVDRILIDGDADWFLAAPRSDAEEAGYKVAYRLDSGDEIHFGDGYAPLMQYDEI